MSQDDIFISYAHLDNQPFGPNQVRWVNFLHDQLRVMLEERVGEEVGIWRDGKLRGNDEFGAEIHGQLAKAKLLVSIVSPRYVKSEWCLRELEAFSEGKAVARVIKVVKTPMDLKEHPETVRKQTGYLFYQTDPNTGKEIPIIDIVHDTRFWQKLGDLAVDIVERIKKGSAPPSGETIYLAETTRDQREARDEIKRELQQHGHRVLPDSELSDIASELREDVRACLRQCKLSVHLIGARYGFTPGGGPDSVAQIQYEMAMERDEKFQRLIWIPPGLSDVEPNQQEFIDRLRNDPRARGGVELLSNKLEDLKPGFTKSLN